MGVNMVPVPVETAPRWLLKSPHKSLPQVLPVMHICSGAHGRSTRDHCPPLPGQASFADGPLRMGFMLLPPSTKIRIQQQSQPLPQAEQVALALLSSHEYKVLTPKQPLSLTPSTSEKGPPGPPVDLADAACTGQQAMRLDCCAAIKEASSKGLSSRNPNRAGLVAVGALSVQALTASAQDDPQHRIPLLQTSPYLQNLLQTQEVAFALPAGCVHLFIIQHQSLQQCSLVTCQRSGRTEEVTAAQRPGLALYVTRKAPKQCSAVKSQSRVVAAVRRSQQHQHTQPAARCH